MTGRCLGTCNLFFILAKASITFKWILRERMSLLCPFILSSLEPEPPESQRTWTEGQESMQSRREPREDRYTHTHTHTHTHHPSHISQTTHIHTHTTTPHTHHTHTHTTNTHTTHSYHTTHTHTHTHALLEPLDQLCEAGRPKGNWYLLFPPTHSIVPFI